MGDNYHRNWECPFFHSTTKLSVRCECGVVRFHSRRAIRCFIERFCASNRGYHNCTLCQSMTNYYEEEFKNG